jgi:hypothetical protein
VREIQCIFIYMYNRIRYINILEYVYIYTLSIYVYVYYIYICMYMYIYSYMFIIYIYVCICTYIRICLLYIYMYVYVHIFRATLQNAVVDSSVVNITGFKPNSSSGNKGNRVVEVLSEQADIIIIGKDYS